MLPDEVLKEIEKGPQGPEGSMRQESHRAFATRTAELATKLEREACAELARCYTNGGMEIAEAIEARGK